MFDFTKHVSTRLRRVTTPQAEPILNSNQVPNSAGGYVWAVDHWTRLDRFLVLGAEGGTFYVGERELTRESASAVITALAEDGARVVRRTIEISESGRAPKNDPALFVLAMAAALGDDATRAAALTALRPRPRTSIVVAAFRNRRHLHKVVDCQPAFGRFASAGSLHRLGPGYMSFEAKRFRHLAIAIP